MNTNSTFGTSEYSSNDIPLFHGAGDIDALIADFPILQFAAGDLVPASNLGNALLYVVLKGALTISCPESQSDANWAELSHREILPGECAGELAMLNGEWTPINIVAERTTDVLVLDQQSLWDLIDKSSGFARNFLLLPSFGKRMRQGHSRRRMRRDEYYRQLSLIDSVDKLQNRAWLDEHLAAMVKASQESNCPFSILMINLDYMEHFSEVYDHQAAEEAFRMASGVLISSLRPTDIAVRYSDSQLVVILPKVNVHGATMVAHRLHDRMQMTVVFADMREALPHLTASFGVACLEFGQNANDLIATATAANNRARNSKTTNISVYVNSI